MLPGPLVLHVMEPDDLAVWSQTRHGNVAINVCIGVARVKERTSWPGCSSGNGQVACALSQYSSCRAVLLMRQVHTAS